MRWTARDCLAEGEAETILAHLESGTAATASVELRVLGGAMAPVDSGATAFGHRHAKLMVNIASAVMTAYVGKRAEYEAWTNGLAFALSNGVKTLAYSGSIGVEGEDGVQRAYPPATVKSLTQVKTLYDPSNLFRLSLNVAPDLRGS